MTGDKLNDMQNTTINYPEDWNQLPKHERRKMIRELRREQNRRFDLATKIRNYGLITLVVIASVFGYLQLTKKSSEQIEFEKQVKDVFLDGKVEEFQIEGRDHVSAGTIVGYQTNPPTSGPHLGEAKSWGIYDVELDDKAVVHSLEHGGIWISYKDVGESDIGILKEIGKQNSQSTVVSPRPGNDNKVVVASWGRMMRLDTADKALIQKYINTYKNQSPEKLAK